MTVALFSNQTSTGEDTTSSITFFIEQFFFCCCCFFHQRNSAFLKYQIINYIVCSLCAKHHRNNDILLALPLCLRSFTTLLLYTPACRADTPACRAKWHPLYSALPFGPWSNAVHYKGNRVSFRTQTLFTQGSMWSDLLE